MKQLSVNRKLHRTRLASLVVLAACTVTGCRSGLDMSALRSPRGGALDERPSIDGIMGPTERNLQQVQWEKQKEELSRNASLPDSAALAAFEEAEALYRAGNYKEAEKRFKAMAKERRYKDNTIGAQLSRLFGTDTESQLDPHTSYGDPLEEDALFMLAECQFAQRRYPYAQDSYDDLLNRYPSTRHLDAVTRRLFRISQYWLGFSEDALAAAEKSEIEMAEHVATLDETDTNTLPKRRPSAMAVVPNVADRSRPVFDAEGRAIQALRSIWLHDAAGPLADDALMLSANHYLRKGDYIEAARYYRLVREQYPDSPHFKHAYILGSHVTLASYSGPGVRRRDAGAGEGSQTDGHPSLPGPVGGRTQAAAGRTRSDLGTGDCPRVGQSGVLPPEEPAGIGLALLLSDHQSLSGLEVRGDGPPHARRAAAAPRETAWRIGRSWQCPRRSGRTSCAEGRPAIQPAA